MKTKLNISTFVLTLSGFIAVQTATAQAPNPHPAQEALKGLQPFIGNWAGEFEAYTPLDHATLWGHKETSDFIRKHGGKSGVDLIRKHACCKKDE